MLLCENKGCRWNNSKRCSCWHTDDCIERCPHFAQADPEYFLCQECGSEFSTEEVSGDPREYGCPDCGSLDLDEEVCDADSTRK